MFKLLADENFNSDIVRGLLLRRSDLDVIRVQDVGLAGRHDPEVLGWAAQNQRIVLTQDRASMPDYAYERVVAGKPMPGIFVFHDRLPAGDAIREILLIVACSEQLEWDRRVVYLPL